MLDIQILTHALLKACSSSPGLISKSWPASRSGLCPLHAQCYGRTGRSVPHSHEFLNQREIELRTHRFHHRDRPIKAQMHVSAPKAANQFEFLTPPLSCQVPATVSESDFGPAQAGPPSITQPIAEVHGHSRCRAGNPLWFRNSRKSGAGGN